MARCSSHSIKKLARIGVTGLPMAVPNFCLNNCPLKLKHVVVAINSVGSIISSTSRYVLSLGSRSFSRRSLMMGYDSCIGGSWSNVTEDNSSATSLEFLT